MAEKVLFPIAIAHMTYGTDYKTGLRLYVSVSVTPSVRTPAVAFLYRRSAKLART